MKIKPARRKFKKREKITFEGGAVMTLTKDIEKDATELEGDLDKDVEKDKTGDTTDDPRTFFKNILPNRLRKDEDKKKKGDKVILTESVSDTNTEILETDVTAEEAEEANPEDEIGLLQHLTQPKDTNILILNKPRKMVEINLILLLRWTLIKLIGLK